MRGGAAAWLQSNVEYDYFRNELTLKISQPYKKVPCTPCTDLWYATGFPATRGRCLMYKQYNLPLARRMDMPYHVGRALLWLRALQAFNCLTPALDKEVSPPQPSAAIMDGANICPFLALSWSTSLCLRILPSLTQGLS